MSLEPRARARVVALALTAALVPRCLVPGALGGDGAAGRPDAATHGDAAEPDAAAEARDAVAADARDAAAPYAPPPVPARLEEPVARLRAALAEAHIPGAAFAVLEDGRLAYAAGYGVRRAGRPAPVTDRTVFRVGSIVKQLTAAAALSLVDAGRLDLDAPVTRYVPTLRLRAPADPSTITTRMLLAHRSGLPDDLTLECPVGPDALAQLARARSDTPLWAPPGRVFNYSNLGFALAGLVLEGADGRPFDELLRARVLAPAGLRDATFDPAVARRGDYATGHVVSEAGGVGLTFEPDAYDCGGAHPAGYLFASVRDYAAWLEALFADGGAALSPASARAQRSPEFLTRGTPDERYGLGLYQQLVRGTPVLAHSGFVLGWETALYALPARGAAVVLFLNANPARFSVSGAARQLFEAVAGLTGSNPSYRTEPARWSAYAGVYQDPHGLGRIEVTLEGDALRASIENRAGGTPLRGPLYQQAADTFYFDGGALASSRFSVTFWREPEGDGSVTYFVTRYGVGARVP